MGNIVSSQTDSHSAALPGRPASPQDTAAALRIEGDAAATARNACYEKSKAAYDVGDHAGAKYWSQQGKRHAASMASAHSRAASTLYAANNAHRSAWEVDLHGLRVREAEAEAERVLADAHSKGQPSVVFIVGKGLHSKDSVARLKPAIVRLMDKHSLRCTAGVPNDGCVTVQFVPKEQRGWSWSDMCVVS